MYFLNQALYNQESNFLGVTLDCYNENKYTERITRCTVDINNLPSLCNTSDNIGFCIKDNAVLSDNNNGYTINSEQYDFIKQAIENEKRIPDLIDLVLTLLECDGCILPDFYNTSDFTGQELIAAKNLKVSKSSFNIYGYIPIDGAYETLSLYNSDEIKPKTFYIGVPSKTDMSKFNGNISLIDSVVINGINTDVYCCNLSMIGYTYQVADSLINYLGFYSGAYNIYRKLIESNLKTYAPSEPLPYRKKESKINKHKINITATHTNDGFNNFETAIKLAANPETEFPITDGLSIAIFYTRSLANMFNQESGTMQEKALKVCLSLLEDIKKASLKCNLELLSIRYYFLNKLDGLTTDTSIRKFKGGDVYGSTIFKRVGW